jgi:hypothetical protein
MSDIPLGAAIGATPIITTLGRLAAGAYQDC